MKVRSVLILAGLAASSLSFAGAGYHLLVAETFAGSAPPSQWGGIRRYNFTGTGSAAVQGTGIAASALSDPAGLAFGSNGELYVGNRHGNAAASSINRFKYNANTDSYTANGVITGNSLFGTHGIGLSSTGDIFASNVNGPISRFSQVGNVVSPAGTMTSGATRDAFVSPDNQWVYVTEGTSGNLRKYNRATGTLANNFGIPSASGLHNGSWRGNELYLAAFSSGTIHRLVFDSNGNIASSSIALFSANCISLAFSPDGQEMYVAGHTNGMISRYLFGGGSWNPNGTIQTGVNLGDIQVVPEPTTMAALGLGALALAKRRRAKR